MRPQERHAAGDAGVYIAFFISMHRHTFLVAGFSHNELVRYVQSPIDGNLY